MRPLARPLPAPILLVLGLLALLLWGQCGNSSGPSYQLRVARVDSLSRARPGIRRRLFVTISIHNHDLTAMKLESMSGVLLYHDQYWSDFNNPQQQGLAIPGRTELLVPLVLPLVDSLVAAPGSLRRLQWALRGGTARDSALQLELGANAELPPNGYLQDNGYPFPLPPLTRPPVVPRP